MLASETSDQNPNPQSLQFVSPESDYFGTTQELPPDPLLDAGAFITENITCEQTLAGDGTPFQDQVEHTHQNSSEPEMVQAPETSENGNGGQGVDSGPSNNGDFESPSPLNASFPMKTPGNRGRKRKSVNVDAMSVTISSIKPEWLPAGWYVEDRLRTSGASAGARDKYYCDPISGQKFRSRQEIIRFQETGNKHKRGVKVNKNDDVKSGGSSRKRKDKKPKSSASAANFDHVNVPKSISWVMNDTSQGSWTPFIGNVEMPQSSKEEWAATFKYLATKNTRG